MFKKECPLRFIKKSHILTTINDLKSCGKSKITTSGLKSVSKSEIPISINIFT